MPKISLMLVVVALITNEQDHETNFSAKAGRIAKPAQPQLTTNPEHLTNLYVIKHCGRRLSVCEFWQISSKVFFCFFATILLHNLWFTPFFYFHSTHHSLWDATSTLQCQNEIILITGSSHYKTFRMLIYSVCVPIRTDHSALSTIGRTFEAAG